MNNYKLKQCYVGLNKSKVVKHGFNDFLFQSYLFYISS